MSGREFTVNTGLRKVSVDTDKMAYDPMDAVGVQKIKKGDRVSVSGTMETDLFEGRGKERGCGRGESSTNSGGKVR